jgi:hypothetical protein
MAQNVSQRRNMKLMFFQISLECTVVNLYYFKSE